MEETLRQQIDLITRNLQNVTAKCDINAIGKTRIQGTCDRLRNVVITTSVDYKSLPNVTKESNNTEAILKKDLAKQINKVMKVYRIFKQGVMKCLFAPKGSFFSWKSMIGIVLF